MAKLEILTHPHTKLKKVCEPVAEISDKIRSLCSNMLETMYAAPGVGLAAPQVGVLKRIFVMDCSGKEDLKEPIILINPEIIWASKTKLRYEEGCLSIPETFAEIERAAEVKVKCLDKMGIECEHHFDGLSSTCAQHEIDHLNGILFIDYLGSMRRSLITSKIKKKLRVGN